MDKGMEALIARKGNAVTGNYYLAECGNCSEMFPSERMTGGEALYAGDYGDCYCPHCGAADCDISDYGDILSNAGLAWNYQQKHIDALIAALEQAQQNHLLHAARLINERASLKERIAELESQPLCVKSNDAMREAAPLCVKLPDSSSKAFWSGIGKTEQFHPETYKRWVKEAIERAGDIAGIMVEVR